MYNDAYQDIPLKHTLLQLTSLEGVLLQQIGFLNQVCRCVILCWVQLSSSRTKSAKSTKDSLVVGSEEKRNRDENYHQWLKNQFLPFMAVYQLLLLAKPLL